MGLLCEICADPDCCTCGPCQCKWCRFERGEATALEVRQVKAFMAKEETARFAARLAGAR